MSFHGASKVTLPNGSSQEIRSLEVGSLVLGVNTDGLVVPTEILEIRKLDASNDWHNLRTPRHETALGSSFFSLITTSDQQVMLKDGVYRSVKEISVGDEITGITSTLNLDQVQKSILVGILLGDGSLQKGTTPSSSWSLRWSHSKKQEEYLKWTVKTLGALAKLGQEETSGYGSHMLTARTSHHPDIRNLFTGFDKPAGHLPSSIELMINPISLLFWYLDDGSLASTEHQQDRASFATYSFSEVAIEHLRAGLLRLGIESRVQSSSKGLTIRLNYQASRMMFTMIAPLVPPSMQYKLPVDLRGSPGWMPKPHLVPGYRFSGLQVIHKSPKMLVYNDINRPLRSKPVALKTSIGNLYVNGMLLKDAT